jgi:polysaccharide deacetylase 2 family uncharacterized protein YibQ
MENRRLLTLLLALGMGMIVLAIYLFHRPGSGKAPAPLPAPSVRHNAQDADTLRTALEQKLRTLGVLKLREGDILQKDFTLGDLTLPVYQEIFRLPRRFTPEQLADQLRQACESVGAFEGHSTTGEDADQQATFYNYVFAYDGLWTPVTITFLQTHKPRLSLVIDDGGYQKGQALEYLYAFKVPVTLALIPSTEFGKELAEEAPARGIEVICHMPMEGHEKFPKGAYPEYLKRGMDSESVEKNLQEAFNVLPGAVGLNNHMGSLASENRALMDQVCVFLERKGLFFLDSRTSSKTVGEKEAARMGLPHSKRDVFLDDKVEPRAILKQLDRALAIAKKQGTAVAIGHFKIVTLETLQKALPKIQDNGIQLVYLSEVVGE